MSSRTILLHAAAPPKPPLGDSCNGCGVCCASEPCPIGIVVSRRRSGRCVALEWDEDSARYRCGLLRQALETGRPAARLVSRWIGAGVGCDAALEATPADAVPPRIRVPDAPPVQPSARQP